MVKEILELKFESMKAENALNVISGKGVPSGTAATPGKSITARRSQTEGICNRAVNPNMANKAEYPRIKVALLYNS